MKKTLLISILALLGCITAMAQERTERSISIEALGVHNIVGVNFDSRFKGNHGFGYRVGVGYTQGTHAYMSPSATKVQGFAFPLEVNYLLGKNEQKLELGLGCSLGYYGEREWLNDSCRLGSIHQLRRFQKHSPSTAHFTLYQRRLEVIVRNFLINHYRYEKDITYFDFGPAGHDPGSGTGVRVRSLRA